MQDSSPITISGEAQLLNACPLEGILKRRMLLCAPCPELVRSWLPWLGEAALANY
jgi:hypothetical protein